jgi:hypothetical protein
MPIRPSEKMIVKGRWTQIGFSFRYRRGHQRSAVFRCECGNVRVVGVATVIAGTSLSCGCLCLEINDAIKTKHGHSRVANRSPEYEIWTTMKQRCENPNMHKYPSYGGRGITVCKEWQDFSVFLADMGPRPEGCSVERIDNSKGYGKDNCRWASRKDQQRNLRTNRLIEFNGRTQCITAWAEELGMNVGTLRGRLKEGWSVEKALTYPVHKSRRDVGT